ncbi:hypothetical protein AAFN86_00680 [Roseomonas sp. CAU 1739]|uniref:hypothetical protein n=1 Tax=Roseomonas sp. CAU 1739 TaxID=3140364 RepID=UPI00325BEFCF
MRAADFPLASPRSFCVFAAPSVEITSPRLRVSPMSSIAHRIVVACHPTGFIPGRPAWLRDALVGNARPQPVLA